MRNKGIDMQTRSQTRKTFIESLRTRNQTKLHRPLVLATSTPRPSRPQSPTKRSTKLPVVLERQYEDDGVQVYADISATGQGTHIRWEYPKEEHTNQNDTVASHFPSYSSLFEGSLSSISSSGSSSGSGSFSSIHSNPPTTDFTYPQTSHSGSDPNICTPPFSPSRSHVVVRQPRPLQRTAAFQSHTTAGSSSSGDSSDPTSIFTLQLAKLVNQRKVLENVEMELEADLDDDDMASNADTEMDYQEADGGGQQASSSNVSQMGSPVRLGPCGTVLVEETQRTPSDWMVDYPRAWAGRQSTHLTTFPTEQNFGMDR